MPNDGDGPSGFFGQIGQGLADAVVEGWEGTKQLVTDVAQIAVDIATTPEGKEAAWETAKSMTKDFIALTHPLAPQEWKDDLNNRLMEWGKESVEQIKQEYNEAEENGELTRFFSKKLGWTVIAIITKRVAPKVLPKCPPKPKAKAPKGPGSGGKTPKSKISDGETQAKTGGGAGDQPPAGRGGRGPFDPRNPNTFPTDPNELTKKLGVEPKITTTQDGTRRMVWEPNNNTRIRFESHPEGLKPGDPGYNPRHHGEHYHVEYKPDNLSWNQAKRQGAIQKSHPDGYKPGDGTGFVGGEAFPGQTVTPKP